MKQLQIPLKPVLHVLLQRDRSLPSRSGLSCSAPLIKAWSCDSLRPMSHRPMSALPHWALLLQLEAIMQSSNHAQAILFEDTAIKLRPQTHEVGLS